MVMLRRRRGVGRNAAGEVEVQEGRRGDVKEWKSLEEGRRAKERIWWWLWCCVARRRERRRWEKEVMTIM